MGKLKDLLLGTPEQRAAKKRREATKKQYEVEIKKAEETAYYKALRKTRVARARKRGLEAGTRGTGIGASFKKAQEFLGSEVMPRLEGFASLGEGSLLDIGYQPSKKKRTKRKPKKQRGTTIKIDGTTITISKPRARKKKR